MEAYSAIVKEMQLKKENKSSEVQEAICQALGISETQFNEAGSTLLQSDRHEEVTAAHEGQLFDIALDNDQITNLPISEEQTLEIFELMLRSRIEQQTLIQKSNTENLSEEELSTLLHTHNMKNADRIYFQYRVEFKQFNAAVKHYADNSSTFETKLIEKEEEIMDDSI